MSITLNKKRHVSWHHSFVKDSWTSVTKSFPKIAVNNSPWLHYLTRVGDAHLLKVRACAVLEGASCWFHARTMIT